VPNAIALSPVIFVEVTGRWPLHCGWFTSIAASPPSLESVQLMDVALEKTQLN